MNKFSKKHYYRYNGTSIESEEIIFFNDFHILEVQEDYAYPIHHHNSYELIVTNKTPYNCTLNDELINLSEGQILFVKPGDWHKDHLKQGEKHYVLHFSIQTKLSTKCINIFNSGTKPSNQIIKHIPEVLYLFKGLENENNFTDRFSSKIQDAITETFFWKLVREIPNNLLTEHFQQISERLSFEKKIFSLFESNYNKNLRTDKMAKSIGISKRSLENYFQNHFKTSPAKAFNLYRLKKTEHMLIYSSKSIKEISYALGYNNQFQFSRSFKSVYGVSPVTYRENNRG